MGKLKTLRLLIVPISLALAVGVFATHTQEAAAACAANTANLGKVTGSFTVPNTGSYRVWSRIKPDANTPSNNSYTLEIDDSTCNITVGDATIATNTWTWVDYQGGNTSSKINVTLTAGTHTYTMYGREAGVQVDRVVFASDTSCVPSGTGDNCVAEEEPADTQQPTLSVSAPSAGANLTGTSVPINAAATDNIGVTKVEFLLDTTLLNTDTNSPYGTTFNSTLFSNGSHTVTVRAYDAANNIRTVNISVTINNQAQDTTKPSVSITSPAAGATLSGTSANLAADATDNAGVSRVEFLIDGVSAGAADTEAPFTFKLNTTLYSDGQHAVSAIAYDTSNNSQTSVAVTITIDNADHTPPSVVVTAPTQNATVHGVINVQANASDAAGISKVEFIVDGTVRLTDTTAPYSYVLDTTTLTNGAHTIAVKAYDISQNPRTVSVPVTVGNQAGSTFKLDFSNDAHTGISDLLEVINHYSQNVTKWMSGDTDGDSRVSIQDLINIINNYGK